MTNRRRDAHHPVTGDTPQMPSQAGVGQEGASSLPAADQTVPQAPAPEQAPALRPLRVAPADQAQATTADQPAVAPVQAGPEPTNPEQVASQQQALAQAQPQRDALAEAQAQTPTTDPATTPGPAGQAAAVPAQEDLGYYQSGYWAGYPQYTSNDGKFVTLDEGAMREYVRAMGLIGALPQAGTPQVGTPQVDSFAPPQQAFAQPQQFVPAQQATTPQREFVPAQDATTVDAQPRFRQATVQEPGSQEGGQ
jgi:hypothetical protein